MKRLVVLALAVALAALVGSLLTEPGSTPSAAGPGGGRLAGPGTPAPDAVRTPAPDSDRSETRTGAASARPESVIGSSPRLFWGRVLVDGAGVESAHVREAGDGFDIEDPDPGGVVSGEGGFFSLRAAPGESFDVHVPARPVVRFAVDVDHATREGALPIDVPAFGSVRVRAIAADGRPQYLDALLFDVEEEAEGASPATRPRVVDRGYAWDPIYEDDGGWMRFERVSPEVELEVSFEGGILGDHTVAPLASGERRSLEIVVPRQVGVFGRVLDARDEPLVCNVRMIPWSAPSGTFYWHSPGAEGEWSRPSVAGEFSFYPVEPWSYLVAALPELEETTVAIGVAVHVEDEDVELELRPHDGWYLHVSVDMPNGGEPHLSIEVESALHGILERFYDPDDPDLAIGPLMPASHRVRAVRGGLPRCAWVDVPAGTPELTLRLRAGASFRFRLSEAEERARSGSWVGVEGLSGSGIGARDDGDGFRVDGILPGTYDITICVESGRTRALPGLSFVDGATTELGVIDLEAPAGLTLAGPEREQRIVHNLDGASFRFLTTNEPDTVPPGRVRLLRGEIPWGPGGIWDGLPDDHTLVTVAELTLAPGENRVVDVWPAEPASGD